MIAYLPKTSISKIAVQVAMFGKGLLAYSISGTLPTCKRQSVLISLSLFIFMFILFYIFYERSVLFVFQAKIISDLITAQSFRKALW